MSDTFTTTESTSWFSRLRGALVGMLLGPLLILAAIGLLFWNEGHAVHRAQDLADGRGAVIDVEADQVLPDNDHKLVHLSGEAKTSDTLLDPHFDVSTQAIKLARDVEMYQWTEKQKSETRKKLGGGEETTTIYTYTKEWSDRVENSSSFKNKQGHDNPPMRLRGETWRADDVTLGAFRLSPGLLAAWDEYEPLTVKPPSEPKAEEATPTDEERAIPFDGGYYLGKDPNSPTVGDLRVKFRVVKPGVVSVIADQTGDTFQDYRTSRGRNMGQLLMVGQHDADAMFTHAEQANALWAWIFRAVGLGVSILGFAMLLNPLAVLADVVPFIGRIVGFGTLLIAMVLGAFVSLMTIAIAWLFFRPILAAVLIAVAIGLVLLLRRRFRRAAPVADPFAMPSRSLTPGT